MKTVVRNQHSVSLNVRDIFLSKTHLVGKVLTCILNKQFCTSYIWLYYNGYSCPVT